MCISLHIVRFVETFMLVKVVGSVQVRRFYRVIKVGKWSVIGAGSVVAKDIPDGVLAVGNRCKTIKTLNIEVLTSVNGGGG